MVRTRKMAKSSVHKALNAIGDRWNHLIIQAAFQGASRYEDFRVLTGASRSTLANRLRGLVANGIFEQRVYREGGVRQSYYLTECGLDLFDPMLLAWGWGMRWDSIAPNGPASMVHKPCGKAMLPLMACRHCGGAISLGGCRYHPGPGAGFEEAVVTRLHRRRQPTVDNGGSNAPADVADLISDRWTGMILSTQYFGIHRFDDIQATLDIATNILTDRLRALVASDVFERRIYEVAPSRYEYRLTAKGRELYPHALSLMLWADKWLLGDELPPVVVTHRQCGHAVEADIVCSACRKPLTPETVVVRRTREKKRKLL